MSGVLKESLASWCEAHGFGILCIRRSHGERFIVVPGNDTKDAGLADESFRPGAGVSEDALRAQLATAGFTPADIDAAIHLAQDWATTITREPGSPAVLWGLSS